MPVKAGLPAKGSALAIQKRRAKKGAPTKRPISRKAHNKFSISPAKPSPRRCTLRSAPSRRS
ncbi:hypothetical protein EGJ09_17375 [Pseudomonas sp. p106]|nr:hypothetical protein EGJ09_17375 [Pseudomonas sp. p106]